MRIYDPRLGRFLSKDPLQVEYPWYTPYQFAGNKPIWAVDLDGLEERKSTGLSFFPFITPYKAETPGQLLHQSIVKATAKGIEKWSKSQAGKFTNGLVNTTMGLVGTIGSVSYIIATEGTGAAVGGSIALQLSLSEMAIGISQMTEALSSNSEKNQFLHEASTLPGLIAYGTGSKYAPFIDAVSALGPTVATNPNIYKLVKDGVGLKSAFSSFTENPNILNTLSLIDQISDVNGFRTESLNLYNNYGIVDRQNLKSQTLTYKLSYTVKKGDNLETVAKRLSTSVSKLTEQNNIQDPSKIKTGQKITYSNSITEKAKK